MRRNVEKMAVRRNEAEGRRAMSQIYMGRMWCVRCVCACVYVCVCAYVCVCVCLCTLQYSPLCRIDRLSGSQELHICREGHKGEREGERRERERREKWGERKEK